MPGLLIIMLFVNYNVENKNTSLITFEGKVAMAPIEVADLKKLGQNNLLRIMNSNQTVVVKGDIFLQSILTLLQDRWSLLS